MNGFLQILKMVVVLAAAVTLGNWFLAEYRSARAKGRPWYAPYLTIPGILILIAIAAPVLLLLFR
ncbi:MAG: hypothetical protein PVH30_04435 [Desulfobacterales bacterium]|jgi:hypothetical protein